MTSVALLAVLLAAGWLFYRQWRFTRFEALRNPGHPQYFGAAICAVYLFALGAALHLISMQFFGTYRELVAAAGQLMPLLPGERQSVETLYQHLAITLWAFMLSAVLPYLFNSPLVHNTRLGQAIARRHGALDQLESLAIKCEDEGVLCGLTLQNGKFYAGLLEVFEAPGAGKDWVAMTPVASGYRTSTGSLNLTTFYDISLPSAPTHDIFRVVVSTKDIVSAQSFDLALYQDFHRVQLEVSESFEASNEAAGSESRSAPSLRAHGSVDTWAYFLYLGLPAGIVASPYVALKWGVTWGLTTFLVALISAWIAARLHVIRARVGSNNPKN